VRIDADADRSRRCVHNSGFSVHDYRCGSNHDWSRPDYYRSWRRFIDHHRGRLIIINRCGITGSSENEIDTRQTYIHSKRMMPMMVVMAGLGGGDGDKSEGQQGSHEC